MTMQSTIGDYNPATRAVPVTFTLDAGTYSREVNACHDAEGAYDADATAARVAEVALGVQAKLDRGVITLAPMPSPEPEAS